MLSALSFLAAIIALYLYRRSAQRISQLEQKVAELSARLVAGDAAPETEVSQEGPEAAQPWGPPVAPALVEAAVVDEPVAAEEAPATMPEPLQIEDAAEPAPRQRESLESMIGARWPVWAGGVALALGGVFLVKYSVENGLISPAVRLSMSGVFGLALLIIGEFVRRRASMLKLPALKNAMVPGILTAAGALTLFGATYAAYAIYSYVGPSTAFAILAIVSLATVALSLLHGQALAGLGLVASMVTPALIQSDDPSVWALFIYLTFAWAATIAASRIRDWNIVPSLANLFTLGWVMLLAADGSDFDLTAIVMNQLVMIAGIALFWPGKASKDDAEEKEEAQSLPLRWLHAAFANFSHVGIKFTSALTALASAMGLLLVYSDSGAWNPGAVHFAGIIAALAVAGAWWRAGIIATAFAAIGAGLGAAFLVFVQASIDGEALLTAMAVLFAASGALAFRRHMRSFQAYVLFWGFVMWAVPLGLLVGAFYKYGAFGIDFKYGVMALVFAFYYLAGAEWIHRTRPEGAWTNSIINVLAAGSYMAVIIAVHAFTDTVVTTILIAVVGMLYLLGTRKRAWLALPWMLGLSGVIILARIGWQPSLVGDLSLSRTPFFNQLLPGYGIPAVLMALGAYALKNWPDARIRNFLQALASLLMLMTAAILTRHALNGGVLNAGAPSLAEQSIYTLLSVGGSAVLMTLDMKAPSPVFRWGSMIVGGISMLSALAAHMFTLNPFFSGEMTGAYPFFNLLLLGYLMPSAAFFGLAFYAREKRPLLYVRGLSVAGALLAFLWVTLSVRRYWQGAGIADWKGFLQSEMYTYSVVWLALGVLLLVVGSRYNAKALRLASAVLVLVAVLKVFLIDMSNLEGILRALSFIGLGGVLIGIGLFYQRSLRREVVEDPGLSAEGDAAKPEA